MKKILNTRDFLTVLSMIGKNININTNSFKQGVSRDNLLCLHLRYNPYLSIILFDLLVIANKIKQQSLHSFIIIIKWSDGGE